ncbi:hypothetical protein ONE63_008572 [Megalurothrips usitatus]|uniref:MTOR-associated protein MEAK7 n=1 Tax=Megalurothrips usitatus TaxID=439358 RepID=A0AAV7XPX2_9NEOP|nr:hypothetical protein ONE63_008572 [Megalurothrips usitatus]
MGNKDSSLGKSSRRLSPTDAKSLALRLGVKSESEILSKEKTFEALSWNGSDSTIPELVWRVVTNGANTARFSSLLEFIDGTVCQDVNSAAHYAHNFLSQPLVENARTFCLNLLKVFHSHHSPARDTWLKQGVREGSSDEALSVQLSQSLKSLLETNPEESKEEIYCKWLQRERLLYAIQTDVLCHLFNQTLPSDIIPQLTSSLKLKPTPTILELAEIMFINHSLPHDMQSEWALLFSTRQHGLSFTSLLSKIINKGPTVIVVEDTEHHVFGGFASEGWRVGPKFIGDIKCFLFKLRPEISVHTATNYNDHHMYLNVQQQTMPNGLGMGGQLENFGIWIDADFGKGHTCAGCSTYQRVPTLASGKEFSIEHIEVWAVGPPPKEDSDEEVGGKRSILDKDSGAKAILEMIDRGHHSEGIREVPDEDY